MELRVLNYFLTIAEEENITKAAGILHITQPTLSRQLMQLEEELGVKLFRRSNHNIILTDEGSLLKRRAQELLSLAEKTKREFKQEESLSGVISIGSGEYKCTKLLAEMIASFKQKYPLVKFELYSGNSDNIKEQIERGSLDLGLLLEPVDISKYDFLRFPEKEEWGVLVSENSELAEKEYICPQDLKGLPIILTRREMVQNELTNWFGKYGEQLSVSATGNLPYNMAALAASGVGVFINLNLNCKYDGVEFIPLSPSLTTGTVLVWKKSQPCSPAEEAFIKHIKKCFESISNDTI
ncbi:MAG: LysR family transcriptional regulator [Candidatus Howiella sp.]|jgi:DNA-binding transcriptional LysR family regulator